MKMAFGGSRGALIPVIRLAGAIGADGRFSNSLNLASVAGLLNEAFHTKGAPAVALIVNSPGGVPGQSALIHRRIRALSEETGKPALAFVEDVAASGGYMIACAADEIFVDPFSLVGSIGVRFDGFGLDRVIDRLGIDRRLYTAGGNKARLDPFRPEDPADVDWVLGQLRDIHRLFIELVEARRGDKIKTGQSTDVYSGEAWHGEEAIALGLADHVGEIRSTLRARYGETVRLRPMGRRRSLLESVAPFGFRRRSREALDGALSGGLGGGMSLVDPDRLIAALETRALWSRYGL